MVGKGSLVAALAGLALAVSTTSHGTATPRPATCGKLLPPAAGVYFGANPNFVSNPRRLEGDTVTTQALDDFDRLSGRKSVWAAFVQHWFLGLKFPREKVMTVWRHGQIPFVRMHSHSGSPFGSGNPPEQLPGDYALQNIIDGKFDPQLRAWADAARDTNIPLIVEYGDEENADWGAWSALYNGAGETTGYGDPTAADGPERFRDAFRHMATLFRREGATNVTWVVGFVAWFQPNRWWESYASYYPGDDYVDWIALSLFATHTQPDGSITSFEQQLQTFHAPDYVGNYTDLTSLSSKPIAAGYVGAANDTPGAEAAWMRGAFSTVRSGRYPRLDAFAWFNSEDVHMRIDEAPDAAQAFREGAADPVFDAKPHFTGNCLPVRPAAVRYRRVGQAVRISWRQLPNATSYEVWRGSTRIAHTAGTRILDARTGRRATYRVRALNPIGTGPFAVATRSQP